LSGSKDVNMLPHRLDSYQSQVKNAMDQKNDLVVLGTKHSGKSFLLRNICANEVLQGKKILFVMNDQSMIQTTIRQMQQYLLKNESIYLPTGRPLNEEAINRVRALIKRENDQVNIQELNDAENTYYARVKRIRSYFQNISQVALFGKQWHELVTLQAFDRNAYQTMHFNQMIDKRLFDFDQKEFDLVILNIQKAFEFNNLGHSYTESIFTGVNYELEQPELAWKPIQHWISDVKKKTRNVIQAISLYLFDKAKEKESILIGKAMPYKMKLDHVIAQFELYLNLSEDIQALESNQKKAGSDHLRNQQLATQKEAMEDAYRDLVQSIASNRTLMPFFLGESLQVSVKDTSEILTQLYGLNVSFEQINQEAFSLIQKELYKINIHNSEDKGLLKIEKELDELYHMLNEQEFLDRRYENTAFSVTKQLSQLESLLKDLNELNGMGDRFFKFYDWNVFYRALTKKERHLIDKLILLQPKDWIKFFRNWFIQNFIDKYREVYLQEIEPELTALYKDLDLYNQLYTEKYFADKLVGVKDPLEVLKRSDRNMYKNLVRKTIFFDWYPYSVDHGYIHFLQFVFPIQFITVEELYQIPGNGDFKWDLMIMDLQEWPDDLSVDPRFWNAMAPRKIVVAGDVTIPEKKMIQQIGKDPLIFELKGIHQQNIIALGDMVPTERLYAARTIAHMLQDTNPEIRIFHLEDYIIFSCLSETLNIVLEKMLNQRNIKKIRVLETPFHSLVENILEISAKQVLITQDNLVNNAAFDRIPWQLYLKEKINRAGIKIADINSNHLLEDPIPTLLTFIGENFPSGKADKMK
jgi:GTPase SAR1 family protein